MQKLFKELSTLDQRCYEHFCLSEDILMEHAADGMADYIHQHYSDHERIIIVCGSGNNGADGIALARLLHQDYEVSLYLPLGAKSKMAKLQYKRAQAIGVIECKKIEACDILVDALFGSGLSRPLDTKSQKLLQKMNQLTAIKIACDIPSGLQLDGLVQPESFRADITLSMGALKLGMFSDSAKDIVGDITVINLGVSRNIYESESDWTLLDASDLTPPYRHQHNTHKGSYGHLSVVCGEKEGAAILSGRAAIRYGTGLVTLISKEKRQLPYELMQSSLLPTTTTAIALGMGLGETFSEKSLQPLLDNNLALLIDADLFKHPLLLTLLKRDNIILTPHPKEFVSLLRLCQIADITVETLQNNRFDYVELFGERYPNVTLLLKGANVIITQGKHFYINPHGTNRLAKGGSGDVLSGIIGALLAQGIPPLQAAIQGSLAHTTAASNFTKNSYSLVPQDLIEALTTL